MVVNENNVDHSISVRKIEANRRNAQQSTGPKTEEGKRRSRLNTLKHGILASALLIAEGENAEDPAEVVVLWKRFIEISHQSVLWKKYRSRKLQYAIGGEAESSPAM
jgi:hypothetical protein